MVYPSECHACINESLAQKSSFTSDLIEGIKDIPRPIFKLIETVGNHVILAGKALSWLPRRPFRFKNYLDSMEYIGFGSLPIILLVGLFTGMVMALQSVVTFRIFGIEEFVAGVTGKVLSLELAPVLTALMLSGRVSSGIATELGTMRISEQIDALESMAVNPIQYLVLPRLVAGFLVGPMLSLVFFVVGMIGAYLVSVFLQGVDHGQFMDNFRNLITTWDVSQGLIKAAVFGFVITLIGCYQGYHASGGGRGVGLGTTRAVVIGSVSVLVIDYFMAEILISLGPAQSAI